MRVEDTARVLGHQHAHHATLLAREKKQQSSSGDGDGDPVAEPLGPGGAEADLPRPPLLLFLDLPCCSSPSSELCELVAEQNIVNPLVYSVSPTFSPYSYISCRVDWNHTLASLISAVRNR